MYDAIVRIISHVWNSDTYGGEQQYIYYGCIALILLFTVWFLDALKCLVSNITKFK